eukprot:gene6397-8808_t
MSFDLVQLKWQQIRLLESLQAIERENVSLKQQLQEAIRSKAALAATSTNLSRATIQKYKEKISTFVTQSKLDTSTIKETFISELNKLSIDKENLRLASLKLISLLAIKDKYISDLKKEKNDALNEAELLKQNNANVSKSSALEIQSLIKQVGKLQFEVKSSEKQNEKLKAENNDLNLKCKQFYEEKVAIEAKIGLLHGEIKRLNDLNLKLEATNQQIKIDARESEERLRFYYQKIVEEFENEQYNYKKTISELEDQIQRLTNSMVGNKSHFAKYVEVKTQNLVLQAQLEATTNKPPSLRTRLQMNGAASITNGNNNGNGRVVQSKSFVGDTIQSQDSLDNHLSVQPNSENNIPTPGTVAARHQRDQHNNRKSAEDLRSLRDNITVPVFHNHNLNPNQIHQVGSTDGQGKLSAPGINVNHPNPIPFDQSQYQQQQLQLQSQLTSQYATGGIKGSRRNKPNYGPMGSNSNRDLQKDDKNNDNSNNSNELNIDNKVSSRNKSVDLSLINSSTNPTINLLFDDMIDSENEGGLTNRSNQSSNNNGNSRSPRIHVKKSSSLGIVHLKGKKSPKINNNGTEEDVIDGESQLRLLRNNIMTLDNLQQQQAYSSSSYHQQTNNFNNNGSEKIVI